MEGFFCRITVNQHSPANHAAKGGIPVEHVTYFYIENCPYCQQANRWLERLIRKHPEYGAVAITRIDERKQPDVADKYDYYYVPTFYVGAEKVHEGAATREKIEAVLLRAMGGTSEAIG